ncbi:MAG: hypothetical protein DWQ05_07845 [Calditrichaeota bacterium]|nr:MAG: hypothetical protein DWQ05_07845 [Calditrichota bacterium]
MEIGASCQPSCFVRIPELTEHFFLLEKCVEYMKYNNAIKQDFLLLRNNKVLRNNVIFYLLCIILMVK